MAKKIFIGATGQNCGKTTMSISLMHLARKKYDRVGFIKPIGPKIDFYNDFMVDMDALLMAKAYGLEKDIAIMSPVALHRNFTKDFLNGQLEDLSLGDCILSAVEELDAKYDFLIVEGAGHGGVGSVIGLNNAKVAKMLNAPVVIVTESGIGRVIDAVHLNLAIYRQEQADVRALLVNKLLPGKRESILGYLCNSFSHLGLPVIGGFNYSPILANPTLSHISRLLNLPLHGNQDDRTRIIHNIQLGAASSQRVIDALLESTLVILTSSRDELIVTLASLYHIPAYKDKIAGMVIAGHVPVSEISQQILDDSNIPYVRIQETTSVVFTTLSDDVAKITYEDQEKLSWIKSNAENDIDFAALDALI
jgi:dethiobiotin synthetase